MSFPEAHITITLRVVEDRVAKVHITSTRMVKAAAMLSGRPANAVLRLLPSVFSLCGTAQALAGLGAVEAAAGLTLAPAHVTARRLLLCAETVSEHGMIMARDWPLFMGEAPDLEAAKRLRGALNHMHISLYPHGDWTQPGGGHLKPDHAVISAAAAAATAAFAPLMDRTLRMFTWVARSGLALFGRSTIPLMPPGGPADLGEKLHADLDGEYLARPHCRGIVYETGPLARNPNGHHNGLLSRLIARLTEVKQGLHDLSCRRQSLEDRPSTPAPLDDCSGTGMAVIEAARGLLAHRVELTNGIVTRMQILAPTEWNFHPEGALVHGLMNVEFSADLRDHALLLVNSLDPCVACTVNVEHCQNA